MEEAIVVGFVDVGESDRILRLLSASRGRFSASLRGARSARGRSAGVLEPGTTIRFRAGPGNRDLVRLTSPEIVASPMRPREDLGRAMALAYGLEVASSLAPEGHDGERLAGLLAAWIRLLEADAPPTDSRRVAFEAKALTFAGLRPSLDVCGRCGGAIDGAAATFDLEHGGAAHASCRGGAPVASEELHILGRLLRAPMELAVERPSDVWRLARLIEHHLGRALRTRGVWAAVNDGEAKEVAWSR